MTWHSTCLGAIPNEKKNVTTNGDKKRDIFVVNSVTKRLYTHAKPSIGIWYVELTADTLVRSAYNIFTKKCHKP